MPSKLVLLTYESWADLYRAIEGLTPEEAVTRWHGSSAIAWTLGHVTHMVDSWINVNFQGLPRHPVIDSPEFRAGGGGEALDWPTVLTAAGEVRAPRDGSLTPSMRPTSTGSSPTTAP